MSDQDTIFNTPQDTAQQEGSETKKQKVADDTQQNVTADLAVKAVDLDAVFADQLAAIKNDQGIPKYSDVSTALHALKASQGHINTLESENETLRTGSKQSTDMSEILEILNSNTDSDEKTSNQQLNPEYLKELVSSAITEQQAETEAKQSQKEVVVALEKAYGEKANEVYLQKASELGLQVEELNRLSALSSKAVLSHFKDAQSDDFSKNSTGTVNTDTLSQQNTSVEVENKIMFGASTQDMKNVWAAAKADVEKLQNEG